MLKFLLWSLVVFVYFGFASLLLSTIIGILAEVTWRKNLLPKINQASLLEIAPVRTSLTLVYGFLCGGFVSWSLMQITIGHFSTHWSYQVILVLWFISGTAGLTKGFLTQTEIYGQLGGKFCAAWAGGYFWGLLLSSLSFLIWRIYASVFP